MENQTKLNKKREKLIVLGLFVLGTLFYGGSVIPNVPFPALIQLLSVLVWLSAALIAFRYLLLDYHYRIEAREGTDELDLVIVERRGRRVSTVCRVGIETIRSTTQICKENRRTVRELTREKTVYRYTAVLFSSDRYLLEIDDGNESYFVQIMSDSNLNRFLNLN